MRRVQKRVLVRGSLAETSARSIYRRQAEKLHLVGWVQASDDGGLELVVNGPERAVDTFIGWIRRGPLSSLTQGVEVHTEPREAFFEFSVRLPEAPPAEEDDLA